MALGVNMTMSKHSEETTRKTCADMQFMENKLKSKRKCEKRDQCCAWEYSDTDGGISDDNAFHQYQEAKQKVRYKCSYLDERNIILSPHLFAQPRSCISGANDASDEANSRLKASQISVPTKSASPDMNITTERPSAPDPSCVPINPSISGDSMTQRQNTVSENYLQVHIVEVNGILPMIEWLPESSHEQMTEETTSWRCAGLVSANNNEALWKKASGKKIEWCHERLAKAAHFGSTSPTVARHRAVTQRLARGRGYRATSRHREQKLKPLMNHKDLHNSLSTLQNRYGCLCGPCQPRLRPSPGGDQRDATENLDRKQQGQQREFSEATRDIQCQSGCPKNAESPPTPHHVTFSHILQVLQSKPANFPEVRGQRCRRAL